VDAYPFVLVEVASSGGVGELKRTVHIMPRFRAGFAILPATWPRSIAVYCKDDFQNVRHVHIFGLSVHSPRALDGGSRALPCAPARVSRSRFFLLSAHWLVHISTH